MEIVELPQGYFGHQLASALVDVDARYQHNAVIRRQIIGILWKFGCGRSKIDIGPRPTAKNTVGSRLSEAERP